MKGLKEIIIEQNSIITLLEKLKINSKSKVTQTLDLDDFSKYIESTSFGKSLTEIKNNKIQTGKFYNISNDSDEVLIYLFPLYITMDNEHCLGISIMYETDENNGSYCVLNYVIGATNKSNKLRVDKLISGKKIQDFNDDINFDKYLNIIKKLYNASKRMHPNDFLLKYEKIVNENNK